MIEEIILQHLSAALDVPVVMEIPEEPPEEFVFVEKTGGGETEYITESTFAVQSYSGTLYRAAKLNERVKAAMRDLITLAAVSRVHLNSDYPFNDTARKRKRYQAVFDVVHYDDSEKG